LPVQVKGKRFVLKQFFMQKYIFSGICHAFLQILFYVDNKTGHLLYKCPAPKKGFWLFTDWH